jgi:hypothetical protein
MSPRRETSRRAQQTARDRSAATTSEAAVDSRAEAYTLLPILVVIWGLHDAARSRRAPSCSSASDPRRKVVGLVCGIIGIRVLFNPAALAWSDRSVVFDSCLLMLAARYRLGGYWWASDSSCSASRS